MLHKSEALNASKIALEASEMIKSFGSGVMPAVSFWLCFLKAVLSTLTFEIKRSAQIKVDGKGGAPLLSFSLCTTFSSC